MDNQEQPTKKSNAGRPETSEEDKNFMLQKLEPYLKSGLSLRKALNEANIPQTTFYEIKERDANFRSKIETYQQYLPVLLNSSLVKHLHEIVKKQSGFVDSKTGMQVDPEPLDKSDIAFLQWFATTSTLTKEEYGERSAIDFFDPQDEIQKVAKLIDSVVTKK